jgi:aminopeptidase N
MSLEKKFTYHKDYNKPDFVISNCELNFSIYDNYIEVENKMQITRSGEHKKNLRLHGHNLNLQSIILNSKPLITDDYSQDSASLEIKTTANRLSLVVKNKLLHNENTALEGVYQSQGIICTQCEPTGFRSITYFLDRPDVLATYKVKVSADKTKYPVLLANGNLVDKGELTNNRHWVCFDDPFPKPSYLFALVAGDLTCLRSNYISKSGRDISLEIYASHSQISQCDFAMKSLKKSMAWDEKTYNLECDLDSYKIVAISDFNMGAMENKGLNIFNSALVLATPRLATDNSFQNIESVIAHEYFHNWTGNRVTCRDWFQLCLKEGLTVYRDQEFSKSLQDPDLQRIKEVRDLLEQQVPEDTGPLSHPPRPDKYMEINNLYTATVYEKGAECIRMLETLLGKDMLIKGVKHYLKKFDGTAATQEDFIKSIEEVSQRDLQQFMLWYTQPGIPEITYLEDYNKKHKKYSLTITQNIKKHPDYDNLAPRLIPIKVGLLSANQKSTHLLKLTKKEQTFNFENILEKPALSILQGFCAPVKINTKLSNQDHLYLLKNDQDPFNRWKLFQDYFVQTITSLVNGSKLYLEPEFISAFEDVLQKSPETLAVKSAILELPSEKVLFESLTKIEPQLVIEKKKLLKYKITEIFYQNFLNLYNHYHNNSNQITPKAIGKRRFKNMCLGYLASFQDDQTRDLILKQISTAQTMSDEYSAFSLLCQYYNDKTIVNEFYQRYSKEELVVNMWFSAQAANSSLAKMQTLVSHPDFNLTNPNRLRSVVGSFCKNNLSEFHKQDGQGYKFCAELCKKIDKINPQMSASLAGTLVQWKKFSEPYRTLMGKELEGLSKLPEISKNLYEVIAKSLA